MDSGPGPALHNPEAEIQVLGSCLIDRDAAETVCASLRGTDLSTDRHQQILSAVRQILSLGDTPTPSLVGAELHASGHLQEIGGAYLAQLWDAVPSAANVRRHIQLVQDAASRRRLRKACLAAAEATGDGEKPLPELLAELTEDLGAAGDGDHGRAIVPVRIDAALKEWLSAYDAGPPPTVPIGYTKIDDALGGGPAAGDMMVLASRAGVGKTALALEIARRTAETGRGVLVVSREMRVRKLLTRMLAQTGRVSATNIKRASLTPQENPRLQSAYSRLSPLPLWLDDRATQLSQIRQMVEQWPFTPPLGLVIVDYLQLVRVAREIRDRRLQVEAVSSGLKEMAMQAGVPVIVLSSLSRAEKGQQDRRPVLSDLRESGEIEHDADIVLFLHRQFAAEETEAIIAKARDGSVGVASLTFRGEYVSFDLPS